PVLVVRNIAADDDLAANDRRRRGWSVVALDDLAVGIAHADQEIDDASFTEVGTGLAGLRVESDQLRRVAPREDARRAHPAAAVRHRVEGYPAAAVSGAHRGIEAPALASGRRIEGEDLVVAVAGVDGVA